MGRERDGLEESAAGHTRVGQASPPMRHGRLWTFVFLTSVFLFPCHSFSSSSDLERKCDQSCKPSCKTVLLNLVFVIASPSGLRSPVCPGDGGLHDDLLNIKDCGEHWESVRRDNDIDVYMILFLSFAPLEFTLGKDDQYVSLSFCTQMYSADYFLLECAEVFTNRSGRRGFLLVSPVNIDCFIAVVFRPAKGSCITSAAFAGDGRIDHLVRRVDVPLFFFEDA